MRLSTRVGLVEPFYVMEMAKAASELARKTAGGERPMIFLNIGEPDFTAPPLVQEAAQRAVRDGTTQYTQATGLGELRERISHWYAQRFQVAVPAQRIVVTAGASAALHLASLTLVEAGDEMLLPDPSYPCNRHFVIAADGSCRMVPTSAQERFQLSADKVAEHWRGAGDSSGQQTRGVLLASPSNPTGSSIDPGELRRIHEFVSQRGAVTIVDEIYLGLSFEQAYGQTALALDDQVISVNSFSKYFSMTGWRLGWLVVPEGLVAPIERLAQNLFICPSTLAQHAALACFEAGSLDIYEERRRQFKLRRDYFIPQLNALGLSVPVWPDGAFYAWADCSDWCRRLGLQDSWDFAQWLLHQAHVAVTPGRDFGSGSTRNFIRFSTASSMAQLEAAVSRMARLFDAVATAAAA
jgi:aspartate/methionine/tyrosine aminotransferase